MAAIAAKVGAATVARPTTSSSVAVASTSLPSLSLNVSYENKKYPITIDSAPVTAIRRVAAIVDATRRATQLPLVDHVVYIDGSDDAIDSQSSIDDHKITSSTTIRVAPPVTSQFGAALFSKLNEPGGVEYLYQRIDALNNKLRAIDASGKSEELELPSVIVVGDQSVGKSSLIVAMIGMDILPRKEGTCTRTPLEIHMRKKNKFDTETESSFARFEATSAVEVKDVPDIFKGSVLTAARPLPSKVFPLSNDRKSLLAIRDEIERRTTFLAGEFGIVPYPIVLTLVFPAAPNLRIVDLPGICQHPKKGQPENIKELTTNLVTYYVSKSRTIVLSIIAANYEFQGQYSWNIVRDGLVRSGKTVVGVLTFMNCMVKGREDGWLKVLVSDDEKVEPHLANGWVSVITRNKIDLELYEAGREDRDANWDAQKEKEFFASESMFRGVPARFLGRSALNTRLIEVQKRFIKQQLPNIIDAIRRHVTVLKGKVNRYGTIPTTTREYEELCRRLLTDVYQTLNREFERGNAGADIQKCFEMYRRRMVEIKDPFVDQDVLDRKNRGWNMPTGDLDNDSFKEMIAVKIRDRLEGLATELVETVNDTMTNAIERIMVQYLTGYEELRKVTESCLAATKSLALAEAKKGVSNLIKMEKTYVFDPSQVILTLNSDKVKQLNTYFDFVKTNLASSVPKSIMFFYCYPLLHGLRDKLPFALRNENKDVSDDDFYVKLGGQSGESASQRLIMAQQLVVLQEAWDDLRHWQARN